MRTGWGQSRNRMNFCCWLLPAQDDKKPTAALVPRVSRFACRLLLISPIDTCFCS
jgi:hypothetical protein